MIRAIKRLETTSLTHLGLHDISGVRSKFKDILEDNFPNTYLTSHFTPDGIESIQEISRSLQSIGGSYFGMLQGRWPLHLLTEVELPSHVFESDVVHCRLQGNREGNWRFTPSGYERGECGWFELQFFLPVELAQKMAPHWGRPDMVAQTKSEYFSFISMSGCIGGIWRNIKIQLDREWLSRYLHENRD
ncbi:MAG: hypothetical protein HRU25_13120 [Psychrobium sp.]|nr:hypothetical protein [Psychrobium sp.]